MTERYAARDDDQAEATYRVPPARRRLMDFGTRRLALIAGFLGCLVVLAISVWSALGNHRGGTPPVIEAARGPMRVRPENPGGMQLAGQNEDILSSNGGSRAGQLAPAPEAPAPQVLRARQQAAAAAAAAPPVAQPVSLPPITAAAGEGAVPPTAVSPPVVRAPPASVIPNPVTPSPLTSPVVRPAVPSGAAAGRVQAQLAAVASEQAAKSEWQRLAKRMPDILGGRQPVVVKVDREGQVVWRLRTGGFADQAQATAFCERVKAKGANCAVAAF